jgi:hypothetical protein
MSGAPQCSACQPSCIRKKSTPLVVFSQSGDADKLALVRAGVGHPGSHQRPATPGTYTPHQDIPGAI